MPILTEREHSLKLPTFMSTTLSKAMANKKPEELTNQIKLSNKELLVALEVLRL